MGAELRTTSSCCTFAETQILRVVNLTPGGPAEARQVGIDLRSKAGPSQKQALFVGPHSNKPHANCGNDHLVDLRSSQVLRR